MMTVTVDILDEKVRHIEDNNYFQENLSKLSKVIEHRLKDNKDLVYWIDYYFEVGPEHVIPYQFRHMNTLQYFDLDIHAVFLLAIVLVVYLFLRCFLSAVKFCCFKKNS